MGDSSDNIPGIKGIGEKTALKLLIKYGSLESIYDNIDDIKGSIHEKLILGKEDAFMSKKLATIYREVPLDISLNDLLYTGSNNNDLKEIYTFLEFASFIKKADLPKEGNIKYIKVTNEINVVLESKVALYLELTDDAYNHAFVFGASICDSKHAYYFDNNNYQKINDLLKDKEVITYDNKKNLYFLENNAKKVDDIMISSYLLGYNVKDDLAYLANSHGENLEYRSELIKKGTTDETRKAIVQKTQFIYNYNDTLVSKLHAEKLYELYANMEMPLIPVLSAMEKNGIKVDRDILIKQGSVLSKKIADLTKEIHNIAEEDFNIASVKQLGEVLFEKLKIGDGKKTARGYKTDVATLEKLIDVHPIIKLILEYRNYTKIKSTYIDGLLHSIDEDGNIHTIFKQTITRTGRLSSIEPNLQNIPLHEQLGRQIRKAFIPQNDIFLSCDYSQIELRILGHITHCQSMIETFLNDGDIHTKVASDINGVPPEKVTKEMRSNAKSVIFGIVYGISGFGLMENLNIRRSEAEALIKKYYSMYPEVYDYMQQTKKQAKENGFVTTLFDRKRVIDEINNPSYVIRQMGERMAINAPIQGTAADIMKMAMIKVAEEFKNENIQSKLVLQIHDELIFDVKNEELEKVKKIVKNVMENIIQLSVPLKISSDTGQNWYDVK